LPRRFADAPMASPAPGVYRTSGKLRIEAAKPDNNCRVRKILLTRMNYKKIALILFIVAICLRALLCILNPPENAFDNHFEPISLIVQHGKIPTQNACWECFQPPVYYVISAGISKIAAAIGAQNAQIMKLLQLICCFYGIITVGIIYLILNKFQLSDFSKTIAFGTICFLPRHIYMSAMHSNDTISYLSVAICIYILILTIESNFSIKSLAILSLVVTITVFTKYYSLVVIPIVLTVFTMSFFILPAADKKKKAILFCLSLLLPFAIISTYIFSNVKNYGTALPANYEIFKNPSANQPRDEGGVSFLNFKPWESIKTPILAPGKLNSFWTLIYSGMWFDTEPKFLYFMDSNSDWWFQYYSWLRGEDKFPGDNNSMSKLTILEGSTLITLGLFPTIFFIIGCYIYYARQQKILNKFNWNEATKMSIFSVLLISNTLGIIAISMKLPTYSTMKASFLLTSMPAFAIFIGIGVMACEKINVIKWIITIAFATLFLIVSLHVLHICSFLYIT
jgi:hypothetical protein